jgi:exo-beta-1,3-glucanase (GH17 family)
MRTIILVSTLSVALIPGTLRAEMPEYLVKSFRDTRWVAYSPTGPTSSPTSVAEMEKDLEVLYKNGFGGIVTYGCDGLKKEIPKLARKVGIEHVILGIHDPGNDEEFLNAKALANSVDGYCVGNEGIGKESRYTLEQLKARIKELKRWSGKPVTTSEQLEDYFSISDLPELGDWLFPNIHPWWNGKHGEPEASRWTKEQVDKLSKKFPGKVVFCKEVGLPTGSLDDGVKAPSEDTQADYYIALKALEVPFVYFEAFDQVWKKNQPVEPHWGVFKSDRTPKRIVKLIATSPNSVRFTDPRDKGKLKVLLDPSGPGFFEVRGASNGVNANKRTLLLFVNNGDLAATGWFLQGIPPSEGTDLSADGTWVARGQIGNSEFPPRSDQKVRLRIMAVPQDEANKLIKDRDTNAKLRNTGIFSQDLPTIEPQWISEVKDLELDIQDKKSQPKK